MDKENQFNGASAQEVEAAQSFFLKVEKKNLAHPSLE